MKLVEALATGRKFRKVGSTGAFSLDAASQFSGLDVTAGEFELAPEVTKSFTLAQFIAAWNSSLPTSGSVAAAETSPMFARMKASLGF